MFRSVVIALVIVATGSASALEPKLVATWKHPSYVFGVEFSPDGKTLATAALSYSDKIDQVHLWDLATKKRIRRFGGHKRGYADLAFSSDGKTLIAVRDDYRLHAWNVESGRPVYTVPAHPSSLNAVSFSPDGKFFACLGVRVNDRDWLSGVAVLRDAKTGKEVRRYQGHEREVTSVVFSADGKALITGSKDDTLRVWDRATGRQIHQFGKPRGPSRGLFTLDFENLVVLSPDGRTLAVVVGLWNVGFRDLATRGTPPVKGVSHEETAFINAAQFSPDGRLFATGAQGGSVRIWEVATGQEVARPWDKAKTWVHSVAFSPDGTKLAAGIDESAHVWSLSPKRKSITLDKTRLATLWAQLADKNAKRAWSAVDILASSRYQSVPFLADKLLGQAKQEAVSIRKWLKDLDSKDFETREKASEELEACGFELRSVLVEALSKKPSPEARKRLKNALAATSGKGYGTRYLRVLRSLTVLERARTPAARAAVKALAEVDGSWSAIEASRMLTRWETPK